MTYCKKCKGKILNRRKGTLYCSKKCKNGEYLHGLKDEREGVKTVEKKPINPMFFVRGKISYAGYSQ